MLALYLRYDFSSSTYYFLPPLSRRVADRHECPFGVRWEPDRLLVMAIFQVAQTLKPCIPMPSRNIYEKELIQLYETYPKFRLEFRLAKGFLRDRRAKSNKTEMK
jgi:hypothetical protein